MVAQRVKTLAKTNNDLFIQSVEGTMEGDRLPGRPSRLSISKSLRIPDAVPWVRLCTHPHA